MEVGLCVVVDERGGLCVVVDEGGGAVRSSG